MIEGVPCFFSATLIPQIFDFSTGLLCPVNNYKKGKPK